MNVRQPILLTLIALLAAATASAQPYPSFPGGDLDQATLRVQERVEELYDSGAYERAYFIYRNELAPRGDKYAQYMIGYMHFAGAGVPEDPAVALAWYRLAGERGEPSIALARNELRKTLAPTQIARSDALFAELKSELSDRVITYDLIQRDLDLLRDRAGRIPSMASNSLVIDRQRGYMSGVHYYRIIKNRIDARLKYLKSHVEVEDVADTETMELTQIETEINELIAEIDDRQ